MSSRRPLYSLCLSLSPLGNFRSAPIFLPTKRRRFPGHLRREPHLPGLLRDYFDSLVARREGAEKKEGNNEEEDGRLGLQGEGA